ncbi:hypothetical protein O7627_26165 [Solwaraspora sp. WMMD1047]|uniref:hypothetical protein n=1 Tax=Solwaraspora sp. WMMD1047 TaxID=3016102 RepID=UPI002416CE2F|nr:hypothetical protein [Solwaraspora sp. WMMD1047]MDG4832763.1 hypothetical protein [Solwaraspora sp. WMMD1047]
MDSQARRVAGTRVLGTLAILVGLSISLLTMAGDGSSVEPHAFALLVVLTGIGLRVEAAIRTPHA